MTRKQRLNIEKEDRTKESILNMIKKQKPETTLELIKLVQKKTALPKEEIANLLIKLENENTLCFTKKETLLPTTLNAYAFSKQAAWYWTTIILAAATAVIVFTIAQDAYPIVYMRSLLGTLFILFLPGFAFIKALFPSKLHIETGSEKLDNIERLVLSIGMSLALVPITGLILNYTPWGITLTPITLSLLALTVIFASIALIREYKTKTNSA